MFLLDCATGYTMQATNEQVIDIMVDNLFRAAVIDKDEFHRKAKQNIRKTFDAYVHPFTVSEEDRTHRVGMRAIMVTPLDSGASWKPIPMDQILPVLHLEVPKRVVQYMPSATPIVDPNKPKQVKMRGQRGQPRQFKTIKRSQPEVASIYAEADEVEHMDSDQPSSKRSRLSKGDAIEDDERRYSSSAVLDAEDEYEPVARRSTPANFYTVVGPLFQEFWALEFDDVEVTAAFFALITHANCRDYKLEAFAEQSYSLTVIKEKLKNQAYCSIEDFVYDFNQLFTNIFTYYAETHEAYRKAVELSLLFKERWKELVPKFK